MGAGTVLTICVTALGVVALIGIFKTKTAGWGRYSESTVVLVATLFVAALLATSGKLELSWFVNILFAIVGYAGGLLTSRKD